MNIFKRLKTDKKFRVKAVVLMLIFYFVLNLLPEKKEFQSQEVCDSFNSFGNNITGLMTREATITCEASGCVAAFRHNPDDSLPIVGTIADWFVDMIGLAKDPGAKCMAGANDGQYVLAEALKEANSKCKSGKSVLIKSILLGEDVYKCLAEDPNQVCNANERPIADLVRGMGLDIGCKTAYYMVIFGGGMMILMLLGVML